jgi:hypothetical protein
MLLFRTLLFTKAPAASASITPSPRTQNTPTDPEVPAKTTRQVLDSEDIDTANTLPRVLPMPWLVRLTMAT